MNLQNSDDSTSILVAKITALEKELIAKQSQATLVVKQNTTKNTLLARHNKLYARMYITETLMESIIILTPPNISTKQSINPPQPTLHILPTINTSIAALIIGQRAMMKFIIWVISYYFTCNILFTNY